MLKPIEAILTPPPAHWVGNGFNVHNFFPSGYALGNKRMSPFFLLDYNAKSQLPPSDIPRGVSVHPHRGLETVTLAYHGKIAHHDSMGNSGIIGQGDVQWMTAGGGILHKEYIEQTFNQQGGAFQMVQLWVNLPAAHKLTTPKYQDIQNKNIHKVLLSNEKGHIEVVAGEYAGTKGVADTFTPINLFNVYLEQGGTVDFSFPAHYNTAILVLEGALQLQHEEIAHTNEFVLFENTGEKIHALANEKTTFLVLNGEPIQEPVVAYGPFLMNTIDEIKQAFQDVQAGKFGHLEE